MKIHVYPCDSYFKKIWYQFHGTKKSHFWQLRIGNSMFSGSCKNWWSRYIIFNLMRFHRQHDPSLTVFSYKPDSTRDNAYVPYISKYVKKGKS